MDILLFFFLPVYFSLKHACLLCLWFLYAYLCLGLVVIIIALACTETGIKNKYKTSKRKLGRSPSKEPLQWE